MYIQKQQHTVPQDLARSQSKSHAPQHCQEIMCGIGMCCKALGLWNFTHTTHNISHCRSRYVMCNVNWGRHSSAKHCQSFWSIYLFIYWFWCFLTSELKLKVDLRIRLWDSIQTYYIMRQHSNIACGDQNPTCLLLYYRILILLMGFDITGAKFELRSYAQL